MSAVAPSKSYLVPGSPTLEPAAPGVWVMRGGMPVKAMNVYFLEDEGGVTLFDAGIEEMAGHVADVAARMGGLKRIVLGHAHADHRGAAPRLDAPVFVHPDEVADAEGDGGERYFDYEKLDYAFSRFAMPKLIKRWDGGPVKVAGTVSEGDDVAGFRVVHLPGHAPGLIGLWRESDGVALVSDAFYTLEPQTARFGAPRVAHEAFNLDTAQARESMRTLADLEPRLVWAGHANPLSGDVGAQLRDAASR